MRPGILISQLFSFQGRKLYLNIEAAKRNAGAGEPEVRVEIPGPDHKLLEGLKMEDVDPLEQSGMHLVS